MSGTIELPRVRAVLSARKAVRLDYTRRAAVALVLSGAESAPAALLVRRAERPGDPWSGHMALPGGHEQHGDRELLHTARRETLEEVGLNLERAELLGELDDLTPMRAATLLVRPFVFWLPEPGPLSHSHEVAESLWVPLAELSHGNLRTTREVQVASTTLTVPAFVISDRVVWGMTFHLLERFLREMSAP